MKKYGLKFDKRDENAYVLGAGSLPEIVLCEDGQWDNYLPTYEPQAENFESYGCTVWGTQNAIEMIIKRLTNIERNFSERYNYILADIVPPGADPHHVAESIRKYGLVDQAVLPMTTTLKEFKTPKPMTQNLLDKGAEFQFEVKHEYLWEGNPTNKAELIKKALRLSPIGVSVTAWNEENGVYVDKGRSNNHWCVLYGWNTRGWKIFDSYDHSMKVLSFDHKIQIAKRFVLVASTRNHQISLITRIISLLREMLGLVEKTQPEPPQPQPEPVKVAPKYQWDTPALAKHSVRVICDEEGLTVTQKNELCATVGGESGWKINAKLENKKNGKVWSTDWGIAQINDHYHIGPGKSFATLEDAINPEKAIRWMCKQWKAGNKNWWIAYKNGSYKKYL